MKTSCILLKRKRTSGFWILLAAIALIGAALGYAKNSLFLGRQTVSYELARKVAAHYAKVRWDGARIGQGQLYHAPDGTPEVYFFVIFKKGIQERSQAELLSEVATLRNRRIELQKDLESMPKSQQAAVRNIWRQISAPEKYGTVVVGAHEEREPFIASYSGLPPHIILREDAVETAGLKLEGKAPNVKHVWQPPLFIAFEISEEGSELDSVFLEVRGTKLRQIEMSHWEHSELQEKILQKRKQKWQSWRGF